MKTEEKIDELTEEEIDELIEELYRAYGSSTGVLFGIPLSLRSSVKAIVKVIGNYYNSSKQELGKKVTINSEEYDKLKEDSEFLNCLKCAGVDNWDGYSTARDMMEGEEDEWS